MLIRVIINKWLLTAIGFVLGTGFGFVLGIFFFPFLFPQAMEMTEVMPPPQEQRAQATPAVAQGTFVHVNKWDLVHWGEGGVSVHRDKIVIHDDFEVGPGPKYHVYLSKADTIEGNDDVEDNAFFDLGRLRSFKGGQSYSVPSGVNVADYAHVVIWCEAFSVLISPAALKF